MDSETPPNMPRPASALFDAEGLRLVTDNLPALIAYIDRDERYQFVNQAFEARFSKPRSAFIGAKVRDILQPEIYQRVAPWIAAALAGESANFELDYQSADGGYILQIQYIPHRLRNGDVIGFFALMEDVTEDRQALKSLALSESNLARAQRLGNIGSWERDLDTDWISWSAQTAAIFGLDADQNGVTTAEFRSFIHPDDLSALNEVFDAVQRSGERYQVTHRIIRPDGMLRVVLETAEIERHKDDGGSRIIGVVQDITERVAAEEARRHTEDRLNSLVVNAHEAIIFVNSDMTITMFNRSAEQIFGYRCDEIIGAHVETLIPERFRPSHGGHIDGFLTSSDEQRLMRERGEITGLRRDGSEFPAEASISKLHFTDNLEMTVVLRDITERKLQDEKLRQHQRLEAVGLLTGGVAHDFNNLLTAILGSLELLNLNPDLDGPAKEMLDVAMRATNRGAELTDRLLSFSRQQTVSPGVTDVVQAIHDIKDLAERLVDPSISIETTAATGLWPAMVDAAQLENALLNLMINARDAMPEGGSLKIAAMNCEIAQRQIADLPELAPGAYVALSVIDDGIGIPADTLGRVFEPFYTTKDIGKGSGLGLSMVFGFAEQSQGGVTISSQVGQGTTVTIYLPVAETP